MTCDSKRLKLYTFLPMSLYRDYRPQTFNDVVGQDPIITTLQQAAQTGKLAHAYLLAGTRGTGKTSTARILAKTLLVQGITDKVLQNNIEKAVEDGSLVDLVEIDAASNTGVDNIRDLIEKIQFTPVVASAKVYIIDEVHMLSKGAFNALLKTLEEPPAYAYFILATTELHKIPATIQSRCQRFLFRRINEHDIAKRLRFIADTEKIQADDDALLAIAHHAEGGLRDAISLLDQLSSLQTITLNDVKDRIGETGHDAVETILKAVETADRHLLLSTIHTLEEGGTPLETFVRLMLETVRKRLHSCIEKKEPTAHIEPLVSALLQAMRDLRTSPLPALTLESSFLALLPKTKSHADEPLRATREVPIAPSASISTPEPTEPTIPSGSNIPNHPHAPVTENSIDKSQEPKKIEIPPSIKVEQAEQVTSNTEQNLLPVLKSKWNEILEGVDPPSARMSLKNGRIHDLKDAVLTLAFSSAFHRDKAARNEALHNLEAAIAKITNMKMTVQCALESAVPHVSDTHNDTVDMASAVHDVF